MLYKKKRGERAIAGESPCTICCTVPRSPMVLLGVRQRKSNANDETQKNRLRRREWRAGGWMETNKNKRRILARSITITYITLLYINTHESTINGMALNKNHNATIFETT